MALTRAKHSLLVCGRAAGLREHGDWRPLVDHLAAADRVLGKAPATRDPPGGGSNEKKKVPPGLGRRLAREICLDSQ